MTRKSALKPVVVSKEVKSQLERWARRGKSQQRLALRARIILRCATGLSNTEVAEELGVRLSTVGKWRSRFLKEQLQGLYDEPRTGAPRSVDDDRVEEVIAMTLETTPKDATHWSTRSMAAATNMSNATVSRIWRAFGLKPHRQKTFKLSTDPEFVGKLRDVVGLYMNPPDHAVVFCLDEKSQIQALDRTQPLLPMTPGQVERRTHDYARHGTTSLFAALNAATGQVIGKCQRRHRHQEFLKFLQHLDQQIVHKPNQAIHLIMDNYGTHKAPAVKRWFLRHPEYVIHFTPTSASWANLVERFFAEITRKRIRRGAFRSVPSLETAIREYLTVHNQAPKPFMWTATADYILQKIGKTFARTSDTGH